MATAFRTVTESVTVEHTAQKRGGLTVADVCEFARMCTDAGIPLGELITVQDDSSGHPNVLHVRHDTTRKRDLAFADLPEAEGDPEAVKG